MFEVLFVKSQKWVETCSICNPTIHECNHNKCTSTAVQISEHTRKWQLGTVCFCVLGGYKNFNFICTPHIFHISPWDGYCRMCIIAQSVHLSYFTLAELPCNEQ